MYEYQNQIRFGYLPDRIRSLSDLTGSPDIRSDSTALEEPSAGGARIGAFGGDCYSSTLTAGCRPRASAFGICASPKFEVRGVRADRCAVQRRFERVGPRGRRRVAVTPPAPRPLRRVGASRRGRPRRPPPLRRGGSHRWGRPTRQVESQVIFLHNL